MTQPPPLHTDPVAGWGHPDTPAGFPAGDLDGPGGDPDGDAHELRAQLYRLMGDHAALAARLRTLEDHTVENDVVLDELGEVLTAVHTTLQHTGAGAEPTDGDDDTAGAGAGDGDPGLDLARLVGWVRVNVADLLARRIPQTGGAPYWCRRWWEHAEAITRLEAARRSWEVAVQAGPGDALAVYFEHLDHQLAQLMAENGPFSGCTAGTHNPHSPAVLLGQDDPPPEFFTAIDHGDGTGDGGRAGA